jgi:hypothetical protein
VAVSDERIARTIRELLAQRDEGKTICPSDAARALDPEDFRPLMEPVRRVARDLAARGELEVTQKGRVVDIDTARGPIRLRSSRRS